MAGRAIWGRCQFSSCFRPFWSILIHSDPFWSILIHSYNFQFSKIIYIIWWVFFRSDPSFNLTLTIQQPHHGVVFIRDRPPGGATAMSLRVVALGRTPHGWLRKPQGRFWQSPRLGWFLRKFMNSVLGTCSDVLPKLPFHTCLRHFKTCVKTCQNSSELAWLFVSIDLAIYPHGRIFNSKLTRVCRADDCNPFSICNPEK